MHRIETESPCRSRSIISFSSFCGLTLSPRRAGTAAGDTLGSAPARRGARATAGARRRSGEGAITAAAAAKACDIATEALSGSLFSLASLFRNYCCCCCCYFLDLHTHTKSSLLARARRGRQRAGGAAKEQPMGRAAEDIISFCKSETRRAEKSEKRNPTLCEKVEPFDELAIEDSILSRVPPFSRKFSTLPRGSPTIPCDIMESEE